MEGETTIEEQFRAISDLVDKESVRLAAIYRDKEGQVLRRYEEEELRVAKDLEELRRVNNDKQLVKRVQQRKAALQQQCRISLEKASLYSGKCMQYKEKLRVALSETQDMEKEVLFLKEQLQKADSKNKHLRQELTQRTAPQPPDFGTAFLDIEPSRTEEDKEEEARPQARRKIQRKEKKRGDDQEHFKKTFLEVVEQQGWKGGERSQAQKRQLLQQFLRDERARHSFYRLVFQQSLGQGEQLNNFSLG